MFVVIEPSGKLCPLDVLIACVDYWLGPLKIMVLIRGNADNQCHTSIAAVGQPQ